MSKLPVLFLYRNLIYDGDTKQNRYHPVTCKSWGQTLWQIDFGAEKYVNWEPELCGKLLARVHVREIMDGMMLGSGERVKSDFTGS